MYLVYKILTKCQLNSVGLLYLKSLLYFIGFNKACDELKRYQENLSNLPSQNDDEDDDKEESEASNEKEEVESEASKEKDDPYDFDSEMAANNETVSSDKDDSDGEADKDKKEVENSALEVSSTSSPPKKRPCLKVNL